MSTMIDFDAMYKVSIYKEHTISQLGLAWLVRDDVVSDLGCTISTIL